MNEEYTRWLENATADIVNELHNMSDEEINDAFYKDLEFGTGGLRGIMGAGTNRMNTYTVAKASQGIANYIRHNFTCTFWKVAISYDTRINSELFAKTAAAVFAGNGIDTAIYKEPMPTPCLSYAVRAMSCSFGIMITASHNPSNYNGYKVYGEDGGQITTELAKNIYEEMRTIDIFNDIKYTTFEDGLYNEKSIAFPEKMISSVLEKHTKLNRSAKQLYMHLAKRSWEHKYNLCYADKDGRSCCYTTIDKLSETLGKSSYSIKNCLQSLHDNKLVSYENMDDPDLPRKITIGLPLSVIKYEDEKMKKERGEKYKEDRHIISYISDDIYDGYTNAVKNQSVLYKKKIHKNIPIVYTPLHGTGLKPMLRVLTESGYTNISVVPSQEAPDGAFPTCPYPNPELPETFSLAIQHAKTMDAELILANDPDADRIGVAARNKKGEYVILSGNEMAALLFDYICNQRCANKTMPENPVFVKSIVTSDMTDCIANNYNVRSIHVLTGFKYIGEQIKLLEQKEKASSFIFGCEESCGYLSGSYVRDKDGINAALLICDMFCDYKAHDISLFDKLNELYNKYGYYLNTLHNYSFESASGMTKMKNIMDFFRNNDIEKIGNMDVTLKLDYAHREKGYVSTNMIRFFLGDNIHITIRPSGTEPKLKIYISIKADSEQETTDTEKIIMEDIETYLQRCVYSIAL